MEQHMQELAWHAWHGLLPWLEKNSSLRPADLLAKPTEGQKTRAERIAEHANDLEYLKKKMGVER